MDIKSVVTSEIQVYHWNFFLTNWGGCLGGGGQEGGSKVKYYYVSEFIVWN